MLEIPVCCGESSATEPSHSHPTYGVVVTNHLRIKSYCHNYSQSYPVYKNPTPDTFSYIQIRAASLSLCLLCLGFLSVARSRWS